MASSIHDGSTTAGVGSRVASCGAPLAMPHIHSPTGSETVHEHLQTLCTKLCDKVQANAESKISALQREFEQESAMVLQALRNRGNTAATAAGEYPASAANFLPPPPLPPCRQSSHTSRGSHSLHRRPPQGAFIHNQAPCSPAGAQGGSQHWQAVPQEWHQPA